MNVWQKNCNPEEECTLANRLCEKLCVCSRDAAFSARFCVPETKNTSENRKRGNKHEGFSSSGEHFLFIYFFLALSFIFVATHILVAGLQKLHYDSVFVLLITQSEPLQVQITKK